MGCFGMGLSEGHLEAVCRASPPARELKSSKKKGPQPQPLQGEAVCAIRLLRFSLLLYWIVPVKVTPEYVENARTPT